MHLKLLSTHDQIDENTKIINILICGPSQSGKSTVIKTLLNPEEGSRHKGYSERSMITEYKILLSDDLNGKQYLLNMIDTPGIEEFFKIGSTKFNDLNHKLSYIKFLNAIFITTRAGYTHSEDKDKIIKFISFLPEECSKICMLLLTHCDLLPANKIDEFKKLIKEDNQTERLNSFCKQGIFQIGALDLDRIESHGDLEFAYEFKRIKIDEIKKYIKILMETIITCSDKSLIIKGSFLSNHNDDFLPWQNFIDHSNSDENRLLDQSNDQNRKCCCIISWCVKLLSFASVLLICGIFSDVLIEKWKRLDFAAVKIIFK